MVGVTRSMLNPDQVRRQVMRQARYALNVSALDDDRVPPEGPFDVALTNGLLAIISAVDPLLVLDKKGRTLSARALLRKAVKLGLAVDEPALVEGLNITQPFRHGRADDEWIQLRFEHVAALRELDEFDGLQVLQSVGIHRTVDEAIVRLFYGHARAYAERDVRRVKDLYDVMDPEECDECSRRTFIPFGHDDSGGTMAVGFCLACGYQRDEDTAWDMYLAQQWELRWQYE